MEGLAGGGGGKGGELPIFDKLLSRGVGACDQLPSQKISRWRWESLDAGTTGC